MASPLTVLIDEREAGDVWTNQTKTFDVKPGSHVVQLRQVMKSNMLRVELTDNAVADLACWTARLIVLSPLSRFTSFRFLHAMTPKESARAMAATVGVARHVPRNLGTDQPT
jgi:hypothetical protein